MWPFTRSRAGATVAGLPPPAALTRPQGEPVDPITAARLDALASTQCGLVTRPQLLEMGIPPRTITNWQRAGRLVVVVPDTYRVAGAPGGHRQDLMASCLSCDGFASHRAGVALLGAPTIRASRPEITVARGRAPRTSPWRVHECADLERVIGRPVDGIPCVSPPQLAVDLAWLVAARELRRSVFDDAVEWLVQRGCTSWTELRGTAATASERRAPGVGHLRALVDEYLDDGADSRLERWFFQLVRRAGLALPTPQVEVFDEHGFVMRVDWAWVPQRTAVELDSRRYHLTAEAFEADRRKRNRLRLAGWLLLEYTNRRMRTAPEAVMTEVAAALDR